MLDHMWYWGETRNGARLSYVDAVVIKGLCRARWSRVRRSSEVDGSIEDQTAVPVVTFHDQFTNVSRCDAHLHVHRHCALEGVKQSLGQGGQGWAFWLAKFKWWSHWAGQFHEVDGRQEKGLQMVWYNCGPRTTVGEAFLCHVPGKQEMLVPPKLEQGGVCCLCFGCHGYKLKAIKMLMAWGLWCHVALYDRAPCAKADWVVVLKQGCELGKELTVQLKAAVFS